VELPIYLERNCPALGPRGAAIRRLGLADGGGEARPGNAPLTRLALDISLQQDLTALFYIPQQPFFCDVRFLACGSH